MKGLKALQLIVEQTQSVTRTCSYIEDKVGTRLRIGQSCPETTREGKDYCSDHVESQRYVKDLIRRIEERQAEDDLVRREGSIAVNMRGITMQEMMLCLNRCGTRTEERLTRELQVDKVILHNYALRLQREGRVTFGRTNRNNLTVVLLDFDPDNAIEDDEDDE